LLIKIVIFYSKSFHKLLLLSYHYDPLINNQFLF